MQYIPVKEGQDGIPATSYCFGSQTDMTLQTSDKGS